MDRQVGASPTISNVATEYGGGAYGGQSWTGAHPPYAGQPPYRSQPSRSGRPGRPRRPRRRRAGFAVVITALVLGIVGLGISLVGIVPRLLPRQFTTLQQQQIKDWEAGARWRTLPAGSIFPATVRYPPPTALDDARLTLTASRIGIAKQASCRKATDAAAVVDPAAAAVLARHGCEAVLRASYVDGTGSYVVTVGVAVLPGAAQAKAANRDLANRDLASDAGRVGASVLTARFAGTPTAEFTNDRREISGRAVAGSYLIFYTTAYADGRSWVPITDDRYADAEMTAVGAGVARKVGSVLGAPVPPPRCPGTPGC